MKRVHVRTAAVAAASVVGMAVVDGTSVAMVAAGISVGTMAAVVTVVTVVAAVVVVAVVVVVVVDEAADTSCMACW